VSKVTSEFEVLRSTIIKDIDVLCFINESISGIKEEIAVTSNDSCQVIALVRRKKVIEIMSFQKSMRCPINNQRKHLCLDTCICVLLIKILDNQTKGRISKQFFHALMMNLPLGASNSLMLLKKDDSLGLSRSKCCWGNELKFVQFSAQGAEIGGIFKVHVIMSNVEHFVNKCLIRNRRQGIDLRCQSTILLI